MIMSRSVKSVYACPGPAGPKITCSIIFKITIVVLIIQLHDSLAHRSHHYRDPWQSPNGDTLADPDSTTFNGYKNSYGLKFRNPQFELSMKKKEYRISKMGTRAPLTPAEPEVRSGGSGPASRTSGGKGESTFKLTIPKDCEDKLICNDGSLYPFEDVEKLVNDPTNHQVLTAGVQDEPPPGDRIYDPNSDNLCKSSETDWEPYYMRKYEGAPWYLVVNLKNNSRFNPKIPVQHCLGDHDVSCGFHFGNNLGLLAGRKAICKQRYRYHPMVVVDIVNDTNLIIDLFPVPSGCCCHLEKNSS